MLDGLFHLSFNTFRRVPFESCFLEFDSGDKLVVKAHKGNHLQSLDVSYGSLQVSLHPERAGALVESDVPKVEKFRQYFFEKTDDITFDFIDTERIYQFRPRGEEFAEAMACEFGGECNPKVLGSNPSPATKNKNGG
jgi:hypothetical protein